MGQQTEEPFHGIARRVVEERVMAKNLSIKQLAHNIGVNQRSFRYWISPGARRLPAEILPKLCRAVDDYTLLDVLEQQVNRVAFAVPSVEEPTSVQDIKLVQKLVKEVGDALQALADTLEDRAVEEQELQKTLPALDDVIRECVRLKYWVEERYRWDEATRRSTISAAS